MTRYLDRDDVLDLHLFAVERWGGRLGIRSQDRLLAALQAPRQSMFGVELYGDLADKVAVVGFQLLKHRPFWGGNEVTALLVMLRMLAINDVAFGSDAVTALGAPVRQVLHGRMNRDELAQWLRERQALPSSQLQA